MNAEDTELTQVISYLRACLLSVKGGLSMSCLERDYKFLIGSHIPYKQLGYSSLEEFLESIPDVVISQGRNGEVILHAIPRKNTKHLTSLISKQKRVPKKSRDTPRNFTQQRTAASSWQPPPPPSGWNKCSNQGKYSPVSMTLKDKTNTSRKGFEKSARVVEYVGKPRAPMSAPSRSRPTQHTFEIPPRFLKLFSKEVNNVKVPYQPHCKTASLPNNTGNLELQGNKVPVKKSCTPAQDVVSPKCSSMSTTTNKLENLNLAKDTGAKLTPLQARLKSLATKKVPSVTKVEQQFFKAVSETSTENHTDKLSAVCQKLNLDEPDYKMVSRVPIGESTIYSCYVKIGELTYSSFPDEHVEPRESVQLAAKRALQELSKLYDAVEGKVSQCPTTTDTKTIMSRVTQIVNEHQSGIWSTQIPIDYKEKYSELLPKDWLNLMGACSRVSVDHIGKNRAILTPNECVEGYIPSHPTTAQTIPLMPAPINLPEENIWDVYVTTAVTTNEVWIRLIGDAYSVLYENMATDMEMHYMENARVVSDPMFGSFYAVEQDGCWHRVQLLELEGESAVVFFIDHGDEELFPFDKLHYLEGRFSLLPAQAVFCCLEGLDYFADDPNANTHLVETIIGKSLVAEVVSRVNDPFSGIALVLYDTSTDEDINVNYLLAEKIAQDAKAPQLPEGENFKEVYMSYVCDTGDIFLQIQSDGFVYLKALLLNLLEAGLKDEQLRKARNHNNDPSKLYLTMHEFDQEWYRASIIEDRGLSKVKVVFVDYGNVEMVSISELYALEHLSEALTKLPYQAVKVNLHNISFSCDKMVNRVRELVSNTDPVLVKVVEAASNDKLPQVEIFKRITENKQLVSINNTLALDADLLMASSSKGAGDSSNRNKKRLERFQSWTSFNRVAPPKSPTSENLSDDVPPRGLRPPQIPNIGSLFDVHVTMAANPGNFTVQPYRERVHLEKMMVEMQQLYSTRPFPPVTSKTVEEGGIYAALHNDGHWYRVCVSRVINDNVVSAYFCDFGDVGVLHFDKLQLLDQQFKVLPYQAIKAKLSGIQPSHSDWSVEDCLVFQERVVEHQFVSVIKETGPDLLNPSDTVVGLKLIDTLGPLDIHIDQLLVDQNRAIYTFPPASPSP